MQSELQPRRTLEDYEDHLAAPAVQRSRTGQTSRLSQTQKRKLLHDHLLDASSQPTPSAVSHHAPSPLPLLRQPISACCHDGFALMVSPPQNRWVEGADSLNNARLHCT